MTTTSTYDTTTLSGQIHELFDSRPGEVLSVDDVARELNENRKRVAGNLPHCVTAGWLERAGTSKFVLRGSPASNGHTNGNTAQPQTREFPVATAAEAGEVNGNGNGSSSEVPDTLEFVTQLPNGEFLFQENINGLSAGALFIARPVKLVDVEA